jgi:hypothetical protein
LRTTQAIRFATPTVRVIGAEGDLNPIESDWDSFLAWTREPGGSWFHAWNLNRDHFGELAHSIGISAEELDRALGEEAHAKFHEGVRHATLLLQVPTVSELSFPEVDRDRFSHHH